MSNRPTPPTRRPWLWPPIVVFGGLILIAIVLVGVTSFDRRNSNSYIRILEAMLAWPTLAFGTVLVLTIVFHDELSGLMRNVYLKRLSTTGAEFDLRPQPEVPEGERPLQLGDEAQDDHTIPSKVDASGETGDAMTPADSGSPVDKPIPNHAEPRPIDQDDREIEPSQPHGYEALVETLLERIAQKDEQIQELQGEAKRWWHRYLVLFFNSPAIIMLRFFVYHSGSLLVDEYSSRFASYYFQARHTGLTLPDHTRDRAFTGLISYNLLFVTGGKIYVSKAGREFVAFIESPEGPKFIDELRESNPEYYFEM